MTITSFAPTVSTPHPPVEASDWDDFTQLKGIGSATNSQLHESLFIHTFEALAACPSSELIQAFKTVNRAISISQANSWIEQSQHYCDADKNTPVSEAHGDTGLAPVMATPALQPQHIPALMQWLVEVRSVQNSQEISPDDGDNSPIHNNAIHTDAESQYQTIICHRQTGDILACWPGVALEQVHRWLQDQWQGYQTAHRRDEGSLLSDHPVQSNRAENQAVGSANLHGLDSGLQRQIPPTITQVSFYQPLRHLNSPPIGTATPTRPMRHVLDKMVPFAMKIEFQGLVSVLEDSPSPVHYSIDVYAHHRETSSVKCLGHTSQIIDIRDPRLTQSLEHEVLQNAQSYTAIVTNAYLPKAGSYRLKILVKITGRHATPGYFEVPMLRVL